jgi:tetrahydromethanopterin S-methyltransferase subunit B
MSLRLPPMEVGLDGEHYCSLWSIGSTGYVHLVYDPREGKVSVSDENTVALDMRQAEELHRRLGQILRYHSSDQRPTQ